MHSRLVHLCSPTVSRLLRWAVGLLMGLGLFAALLTAASAGANTAGALPLPCLLEALDSVPTLSEFNKVSGDHDRTAGTERPAGVHVGEPVAEPPGEWPEDMLWKIVAVHSHRQAPQRGVMPAAEHRGVTPSVLLRPPNCA